MSRYRNQKSLTLVELLIACSLLALIVLGLSNIELFSRYHVISADRRAQLQNELTYAVEHMSRYMLQGMSNSGQPPAERLTDYNGIIGNNGFRVRVDPNYTPSNFTDDTWVNYTLNGNILSSTINGTTERLCRYIVNDPASPPAVVYGQMPANPAGGFYIAFNNPVPNASAGAVVEIGLVARFQPTRPAGGDNPQVTMKTQLYSRNSSAR